jgi:predicted alpha-1,2-mannosidase
MKRFYLALALAATLPFSVVAQSPAPAEDAVSRVNPLIGSGSGKIGYGGTMPFVTPPFGMTNWTPQTRQNKLGTVSYKYEDTAISGFMGTHQPAIWMGDYGYVTLMPEMGDLKTTPDARKLPFQHKDEIARPDYYSVWLDMANGQRIHTEMTATERCAYMRFTFPKGTQPRILVEASRPGIAGLAQASNHEISGSNPDRIDSGLGPFKLPNFKGYFVVQFRQMPRQTGIYGPKSQPASEATGAWASFAPGDEVVEVRVGTSFLSIEQARANLKAEIPDWNFDAIQQKLRAQWNEKLSRVSVEGATDDQQKIVYTALYHALLYPRVFSESGRYYSAYDYRIHSGESYTAYSIWDTFRAENSLLTLVAPERIPGMVTALLQNYKEGGWMPKWPNPSYTNIMIGKTSPASTAISPGLPCTKTR